ncbi:MAG: murein biosynthesis integral membrane protein MurJ [Candidatus Cloacimonas sp.]|jgi:putative peptidoglycan lipid II flippase|nr:murein biosynthesis integral membrane protein MurJ [Candidatus Cloacimonas sp.]
MSQRKLAKNISMMSIAIFLSRILGLVRDQVMAYFFGTSILNDAFNVGNNIPNLLRRLFGEGALSTAFVPIYNEIGIKKGQNGQIDFAINMLSILTLILSVLTLAGMIFAPLIVKALYPGLNPATSIIAIKLTRIIFPYLFFIGLSSTFIAILNSHDYFFMTGLSSALLNIGMILTLIIPAYFYGLSGEALVTWAAWGVILGGFLQTIINLPYLKKVGYHWKLYLNFGSEAISQLWRRFIPSMIGIGIREINLIADSLMASFLPIGSITALGFGNRLMQLPLGIFAISAGTAVLPLYSRHVTNKEYSQLSESMRFTALSLTYLMLPITTLIIALGKDFVRILFESGAFDSKASLMTSQALVFYSLGLVFYSLTQTVTPLFYANKDTKTPMQIAGAMVALNITLNFILMQFMAHRGLALSTSITAMVNYLTLLVLIHKKLPDISFKGLFYNILKTVLICVVLYFLIITAKKLYPTDGRIHLLIRDGVISLLAFMVFYAFGLLLKLDYLSTTGTSLWKRLHRR